jgi:hypothetical protein
MATMFTDGTSDKFVVAAHEILHSQGLADTGNGNNKNVMCYFANVMQYALGYFKVEKVLTGSGNSYPSPQFEQQWETINRR